MLGWLVFVYCLLLVLGLSSKVEDVVQRLKPEIRKVKHLKTKTKRIWDNYAAPKGQKIKFFRVYNISSLPHYQFATEL